MHIPKNYFSEYFKLSVLYLVKSKLMFFLLTSIELLELCVNIIDKTATLFHYNQVFYYEVSQLSTIVLKLSPYHYFFHFMEGHTEGEFSSNRISFIVIVLLYVVFFIFFLNAENQHEEVEKGNMYLFWIKKIGINFFDYFLYRLMPIYTLDVLTREITMISAKASFSTLDIILLILFISFLLFVSFFHVVYYNQICSWSNFKVIDSCLKYYPYDQFFSSKFDTICYFLKLLITLNQNYILFHNHYVDYISLFTCVIMLLIFISFFIYTASIILYSSDIMFFYLSFYNKLRIFYMLLIIESILFRIFLNKYEDYKPFLIYEVVLILFNCYLILKGFDSFALARVINNQNYLGVCWFIQGNDIDIQHFTAEWITYHKTQCNDNTCLICKEMADEKIDYFSEYCLNDNKNSVSKNILRQNSVTKRNEKKKINKNKNLINQIFNPYKFSHALVKMAERTKKFMSETDLIRLDFLYIMILFLSEVSIEFHLFNELCKLIIKYQDNTNVFVSLILIFDIVRKSNINIIKGYDIIKKNEDLRNSLNDYIKKYENFIRYGDKSPLNYISISLEFNKFKELVKDIHVLFKKNIECNYQLLIMRYAYENLLHLQFKNTQPFDLNYYSDFLDFHFANDKIILMKYFIEHDYFLIIKGSKELLKYQGKQFSKIFPEGFERIAVNKFKEQLINSEQKDIKPFFDFFVKSLNNNQSFGFIESFKMKYFIYPSNTINELYIQANYLNNFSNIMIFQIFDQEEYLYCFSPQLYKITGLTPRMIYSLKKSGNNISFKNLFSKNVNKSDQEKNIYKFQYERYYPFFQNLISNDYLKDNINVSQINDKINEISNMANEKKEILFLITKKADLEITNNKYILYNLKEQKRKKRGEKTIARDYSAVKLDSIGSRSDENSQDENNDDEHEFDEHFEGKGINLGASTLSSASLSGSAKSTRSSLTKGKKGNKTDEKNKRSEELKRYTIIILLFSVFLIMITLMFLILEIRQNNNFQSLFNLFETFKRFKRGVESSPLSLLTNFRYYDINDGGGANIYELFSIEISTKSPLFEQLHIYKVVLEEITAKYGKVMEDFDNYKKSMFKLGDKVSKEISDIPGFSYTIVEDDGLKFIKKRTDLIDLIRKYNNIIISLLENGAYYKELFLLINMGELIDDTRRIEVQTSDLEITTDEKNMLLLVLMYPFIHDGLKETSHFIKRLFDNSLKTIEKLLIIFYSILLVLHFLLVVICLIFLSSYIKMMKINIFSSNQFFSDKKFLEMQNKRIEQIKIMNNLYSEHPLKIAEKIELIDDLYRRKTKEENSSSVKSNFKGLENSGNNNEEKLDKITDLKSKTSEDISKSSQSRIKKNLTPNEGFLTKNSSLTGLSNLQSLNSLQNSPNKSNAKNNANNNNNGNTDQVSSSNYDGIVSKNVKISNKQFQKVTTKEKYILYFTLGSLYLYNIIFFIFVYKSKNNMNILIDYCDINNSIDGYIFDNVNSLIYLYITNSTSQFYGTLIDSTKNVDYIQDGINALYKSVRKKDIIEKEYNNLFPRLSQLINLNNCSQMEIEDKYFSQVITQHNISYREYLGEICNLFPVASSGSDNNILMEILYSCEIMYHKFLPNENFTVLYELYVKQPHHYFMYTLILTISNILRTYFNDTIFPKEVSNIFDSFSYIFIVYLILSVFLEIIIFIILNFSIISDVRKTNKLLLDFMSSLAF
jgi:hypothetical protein